MKSVSRVRIVTDSASDILPSHARALGIILVPNRIVLNGTVWRDGVDLTAAQFYAALPGSKSLPYTLPAPPEDLYLAYQFAFQQGATEVTFPPCIGTSQSRVVNHAVVAVTLWPAPPCRSWIPQQAGIGMWPAVIHAAHMARLGAPASRFRRPPRQCSSARGCTSWSSRLSTCAGVGASAGHVKRIGTLLDAHPILTLQDGTWCRWRTAAGSRAMERLCDLALGAAAWNDWSSAARAWNSSDKWKPSPVTLLPEPYRTPG